VYAETPTPLFVNILNSFVVVILFIKKHKRYQTGISMESLTDIIDLADRLSENEKIIDGIRYLSD